MNHTPLKCPLRKSSLTFKKEQSDNLIEFLIKIRDPSLKLRMTECYVVVAEREEAASRWLKS